MGRSVGGPSEVREYCLRLQAQPLFRTEFGFLANLIFEVLPGHALYGSQESHRILPGEVQKLGLGQNRIRFEKVAGAAAADTLLDDFEIFRKMPKDNS